MPKEERTPQRQQLVTAYKALCAIRTCPKCDGDVHHGYGRFGGEVGMYAYCERASCTWWAKVLNNELKQGGDNGQG